MLELGIASSLDKEHVFYTQSVLNREVLAGISFWWVGLTTEHVAVPMLGSL